MKPSQVLDITVHHFEICYAGISVAEHFDKLIGEKKYPSKKNTWWNQDLAFEEVRRTYHPYWVTEKSFSTILPPVEPIKKWKRAEVGTVDKFTGMLNKLIPELPEVSEDKIEEILDRSRNSEL